MRSSRVLSFAVSLCITFGTICGTTSAASTFNVPTLEDMGVDAWQDLEEIQGAEPQEPPELVDPVVDTPTVYPTYMLSQGGDLTVNPSNSVYWFPTTDGSVMTEGTWNSGESFSVDDHLIVLDFVQWPGATFNGGGISVNDTWITVDAYNQQYADGKFVFRGDLFGSLAIQIGDSRSDPEYLYFHPTKVELRAITSTSDVVSLGEFTLDGGNYYFDEVLQLPGTVLKFQYRFFYPSETKFLSTAKVENYGGLTFAFYDNVEVSPYDEATGILNGILRWLQSILDAILSLPSMIASAILDGLSALFVPSAEDITDMKERYLELFSTRLGFIYQGFDMVVTWWTEWLETMKSAQDYSFVFPGISFPYNGDIIVIVPEQSVSLDNAVMDVLRPILGTVAAMVCTVAFINTAFDMTIAILSGQSYFEFIGRRREEEAL